MLISILILKATDSTQKSKRFTSQSSLQAFNMYISDITFSAVLSLPNTINFFDIFFFAKSIFSYH